MKLAVFTPLNPARCGVSDYSEELLPHLARRFELDVFVDANGPAAFPGGGPRVRPAEEFRPQNYGAALYHIGNNEHHTFAYDAALRHPGIVVLHEFNLHHLMAAATILRDDWDGYLREAEYNGGPEALAHARRVRALEAGPDYDGVAMNRRLLECSRALVVHSDYLIRRVRGAGFRLPVKKIPHGARIPEVNRNAYRARLGVGETTPLIGIFGFLKPYKRIVECLRAMQRLVKLDRRVRMILVGEEHPELPLQRRIEDFGLEDHVRVLGYVPLADLEQWMGAADICLNLRYPTVGETSGTLLRALGLGRAVLVSDVGAFSELPDEICLKVPVGAGEADLITEYLDLLISRPEIARAMGERARQYVAAQCSWERVAQLYAEWIEEVASGRAEAAADTEAAADPAAPALERNDARIPAGVNAGEKTSAAQETEASAAAHGQQPEGPKAANPAGDRVPAAGDETVAEKALEDRGEEEENAQQRAEWAAYIRGFVHSDPEQAAYVEQHIERFLRTLEITPPGTKDDALLEMGAYLNVTPAFKTRLGYGEVRGSYLGPAGRVERRSVQSASGEVFECEIDLFNAETDPYPYPGGRFATVLCCELIEHLYDDPMHAMAEINRILRPGGHLVLTTPNICSLRALASGLLAYHPGLFHQYIRPKNGCVEPRHAREFAPRDVQALFEAAGFEVVRLETGSYDGRKTAGFEWVKHLLRRYELGEHLRGDAIFAVGRKKSGVRERYPASLYAGGPA